MSKFCLCELGAAWITDKLIIPIIVPPASFSDINDLPIRNYQSILIGSYEGHLNLFDRLNKKNLLNNVNLNRFISKLSYFIDKLSETPASNLLNFNDILDGKLGDSKVSIRATRSDLINKYGEPILIGTIGGSTYYTYGSITFYFDLDVNNDSNILSIGIKGEGLTRQQIIKLLGEPSEDSWSDLDSEWYMMYEIGNYSLYIGFVTDVRCIDNLDKNSETYYLEYLLATKNSSKVSHLLLSQKN